MPRIINQIVAFVCGTAALFVALDFALVRHRTHQATVVASTPVIPLGDITSIIAEHNGHRETVTCTREEFFGLNTGDQIRVEVTTTGLTGMVIGRRVSQ